jgi:hypothetical protein
VAVLLSVVEEVRVLVHDSVEVSETCDRPIYNDKAYIQQVERGLWRVNLDLGTSYTLALLPEKYKPLVTIRAAISMCYVRGGEGASSDVEDKPEEPIQNVSVPQLSVSHFARGNEGPAFWLKLADNLEKEYTDALETIGETEGTASDAIEQGAMYRQSLRNGARTSYETQVAFDALELTVSLDSGIVSIAWSPIYSKFLDKYQVWRGTSLDMSDGVVIALLTDNHSESYEDEPGTGTWYYMVSTHTFTGLRSDSAVSEVIVP